ncbi:MAG: hypothetical protein JXA50_02770 [Deltaproteobacteria bacterium]|nr:hypothetical protein [Deltaproteobacteria bacterium]
MHPETKNVRVLGVTYTHVNLGEEGDLYITEPGLLFADCLFPENHWTDKEWFTQHSERLSGTSSLYRVTTKKVNGRQKEIVIKWNRMGQEIPGDKEFANAEFNSPFEEFSLVMDLWDTLKQTERKVFTQKPLAIFVPATQVELWRTGRKEYMMQAKIDKHVEIELDMHRLYAVIYEWIKGIDATQACEQGIIDEDQMVSLTLSTYERIERHGFDVLDRKPHHVIVRPQKNGELRKDKEEDIVCSLVDYELLTRTPEHETAVKQEKRSDYLRKQRDRFVVKTPAVLPSHLHYMNIFGVGYIYGRTQSTDGELWVVGKDPELFDYFLPERWEKALRTRLSAFHEVFHTVTKDNINLVWKVSRVGIMPDMDPFKDDERKIIEFGYNSPFEEVALAVKLDREGIPTIYPRAIYMTGSRTEISGFLFDDRRYETHQHLVTAEGKPVLRNDHDYIIIWGYWNGPDDMLAARDGDYFEGVNALRAWREGIITEGEYVDLMERIRGRIRGLKVEDLNLRGSHILLSRRFNTGELIRDQNGFPETRICNFELLRMSEGWVE